MSGRLHFEAWTLPTSAQFKKKIPDLPILPGATGRIELGDWSDDVCGISASYEKLDQLLSDSQGSWIRVMDGSTVIDEFLLERMPRDLDEPTSLNLTGPQRNGLAARMAIFPPDYPTKPSKRPNWIWAGDNLAGPLKLGDLANINNEYELYLSGEAYLLDLSGATGGTFTLTADGNTTSVIDFDATAATIQGALEALATINTVSVVQADPDVASFLVVFEDPKDLTANATADFALLSGSGTFTKQNDGFDTSANPTFTITVDGQTTTALPWDATLNQVEGSIHTGNGLQGLSNVADVSVTGSGTAADPWVITFYDPPTPGSVTVTFAAGTAVLTQTVTGSLDPSPITISQTVDQSAAPGIYGTYGDPAIEVVTDHLDTGADWALKVNATGRFAGSQRVFNVEPGQTYQVSIRLETNVAAYFTCVIRDAAGEALIAQPSPRDQFIVADGVYHTIDLGSVTIPDGTTQVIMRVAVTDTNNWPTHWVNWENAQFVTGLAPATPTEIVRVLLEDGQDRGTLTFVEPSFTDGLDTAGTDITALVESYQADGFAMDLGDVLRDMRDLGWRWNITDKPVPGGGFAPGAITHELNMWAPSTVIEDLTASGPTLTQGQAVNGGTIVTRLPTFTWGVAWGADDLFAEDNDSAAESVFGRWEKVLDAEQHASISSLSEFLTAAFADEATNRLAASVELSGSGGIVPGIDFNVGSLMVWQAPPAMVRNQREVQAWSWRHEEPYATYQVQGSRVYNDPFAALSKSVERLLDEPKKRRRPKIQQPNSTAFGGGGGIPDVVVAASDTRYVESADLICSGTDDSAILNRAMAMLPSEGGWVHLLEGTYNLTSRIFHTASDHLTFTGAGKDLTIIKMAAGASIASGGMLTLSGVGDATLRDFTLDGNKAGGASVGDACLWTDIATAVSIYAENLRIINGDQAGIYLDRIAAKCRFVAVDVTGHDGDGVLVPGTDSTHVGCRYNSNGGVGLGGTLGGITKIVACEVNSNGGDGVSNHALAGSGTLDIVASTIDGNGGDGIDWLADVTGVDKVIVIGNRITNNTGQSVSARPGSVVADNIIDGNGTDTPTPDTGGNIIGGTRSLPLIPWTDNWAAPGDLVATTGTFQWVAPFPGIIYNVRASVKVGGEPTGQDLIVDVNKNGTTIFSTQANRPTVPATSSVGSLATPDVTTFAAGDIFVVDIDQVGSTTPGTDLEVMVTIAYTQDT